MSKSHLLNWIRFQIYIKIICINTEPIIIPIIVLSINTTTSSQSFNGSFAESITTIVSEKNRIWLIETAVTKNLAPMSKAATLSAINNTGRNISAMPTGKLGAISTALGTFNILSKGTNKLPSHWNTGVFSAIIRAIVPTQHNVVTT